MNIEVDQPHDVLLQSENVLESVGRYNNEVSLF